ncbi:transglutaminase domain-containing protein [Microbacterium sp. C5A9]|uniref:transglutaminase-like domain-containing protein n=1 Tax=Microbacterium sp. C5A9 TaxID=2736663 RepID=UPI001F52485D|nr:transglutaminase-like domain-containing protein [Microbacterium sp. C5A9]MCI1017004.1 transglutaminase domain-containing protein [Microbacterium sp. C5A9]
MNAAGPRRPGVRRGAAQRGGIRWGGVDGRRRFAISPLILWSFGYVVVGILLATAAAWPVYEAPRALVVGIVGGVLGMLVAVVARMLRWGLLLAALAAAGVYLVVAVPLAIPSALTSVPAFLGGLRDAVLGVALGWKQMLTLNPPLGEYQAVLIPFLVVMIFGAFFATLLVMQQGRRATIAVPVVAAMSLFGIAFGLSGTSSAVTVLGVALPAPREWLIGVAVFVSALVWLVGRTRLQRAQALRAVAAAHVSRRATPVWLNVRRHLLSAGLAVVALIAGFAIAPAAAGWTDRSVLRDEVEPMVVVQQQASPLSSYRSWFASDRLDETVLQVDGDPGAVDRIRLVTLDSYDGEDFHIAPEDRFSRLPRTALPGQGRVSLDITIGDAYRGIWVPAPAGLAEAPQFAGERADDLADGFHVNEGGDTAITVADAPGGTQGLVPGDSYSVLVDAPSDGIDLTAAQGGSSKLDTDLYPALAEWAELQEQPRSGAGYLELIDRLRSRGYLSHALLDDTSAAAWIASLKEADGYAFASSYAGHSVSRIEQLFTELIEQERRAGSDARPEMLVSAVGDDEQFSVAAALLAQHFGLESRIVIGARLAGAAEVPGIPACGEVCTGANMSAWVEVRASGGEWMPVDTTPQYAMLPSSIKEGEQLPEHPTVPEQPRSEALDPPQAQSDSNNDAQPLDEPRSAVLSVLLPILRGVGLGLLALVLLVLPLVVLLLAKRQRARSRRTADDPEVRLAGAWEELADMYADHDIAMDAQGTRAQRARSTDRAAAARLAALVDRGVFSEHPPTDDDASAAWAIVEAERADLVRATSRWRRIVTRVRPRSFIERVRPARGTAFFGVRPALGTLGMTGSLDDPKKGIS